MWDYIKEVDRSAQDLLRGIGTGMYKGGVNLLDLAVPNIPKMVDGELQRVRPDFWQNVIDHADNMNKTTQDRSVPATVGSFLGGATPEIAAMLRGNPALLPTIIREMAATYGSGGTDTSDRVTNTAMTGALGGAGAGAGKLLDYGIDTTKYLFSKETPEVMAAQILKNNASDPLNLRGKLNEGVENKQKLYPGVPFNSADTIDGTDDIISAMARNTGNKYKDYGVMRDKHFEAQNQFILDELDDLAGVNPPGASILREDYTPNPGETSLDYLKRVRQREAEPYWDEFDNGDWLSNQKVKDLRKKFRTAPDFKRAEANAIANFKNRNFESPKPRWNSVTAQNIDQELRALRDKALEEANFNKNNPSFLAADNVFNAWRQKIYDVSPQYQDAMEVYAENSPRINSMKVFGKVRDKSLSNYGRNSLDVTTNAADEARGFAPHRLWSAINNLDGLASEAKGRPTRFGDSILPEDSERFDAIRKLLTTRDKTTKVGKANDSGTAQMLEYSNDLKDRVTNTMFPQLSQKRSTRFMNYLLRSGFDRKKSAITDALNRSLYDPEYMSSILRKPSPTDLKLDFDPSLLNLYGLTISESNQD